MVSKGQEKRENIAFLMGKETFQINMQLLTHAHTEKNQLFLWS